MHEGLGKDTSTVASLTPAHASELNYRLLKNAPRPSGSHLMTLRRPSRMPESARRYVPGDPPSLIDWKAYARTDQLIVRELRDEATARVVIGVDLTETMHWPEEAGLPEVAATKAEIALRVGLHLASLHLRMGDMVELWTSGAVSGTLDHVLKPRSAADLTSHYGFLSRADFARDACFSGFAPGHFDPARKADVAFWVGDALSPLDFDTFLGAGRRSMLVHVLSSLELDIGWVEPATSYFDLGLGRREYQGQVLLQPGNYLDHLERWRARLEAGQRQRGGDYGAVTETMPLGRYLGMIEAFAANGKGPRRG